MVTPANVEAFLVVRHEQPTLLAPGHHGQHITLMAAKVGFLHHPATLHDQLSRHMANFHSLFSWGPLADARSSAWIDSFAPPADAEPHLALCYLPHLDYGPRLGQPVRILPKTCALLMRSADR